MATTGHSATDFGQVLPLYSSSEHYPLEKVALDEPDLHPTSCKEAHLRSRARQEACSWKAESNNGAHSAVGAKWRRADQSIRNAHKKLRERPSLESKAMGNAKQFLENITVMRKALRETRASVRSARRLPHVDTLHHARLPRAYSAMDAYLRAVNYDIDLHTVSVFMTAVQEAAPFEYAEIWMLRSFAQLALLERIGEIVETLIANDPLRGTGPNSSESLNQAPLQAEIACLYSVLDLDWDEVFEHVSVTTKILRQDPRGAYSRMDFESRDSYCKAAAELAKRSQRSEQEIAQQALALARGPHHSSFPRAAERRSHVGYYLLDKGKRLLKEAIGYRTPFPVRIQEAVREWPGFFYLFAIELGTLAVASAFITTANLKFLSILELAVIVIPAVECAVATTNLLATFLIRPQRLPKLDFSKGIPPENTTLVVVPALVTSEDQVRQAARDLEIRYLANRDPNLHFALLTDLPDSVKPFDEKDTLAGLCSTLIEELNKKYAGQGKGSFFHFHRHRVYNYGEGIWMGWERKRGKLLDFNNLLLNRSDNFPVKIGDLSILPKVKYVITLDLDTQLPRESAHKLIGALAHPLNRAVIDPATNTVTEGYGILQPRVGISIKSASRSHLASVFSMDTGFDIYTRAVSDVYQDLFGEGTFTGKGIYELETFQRVLEQRFPCNAVLSHDLIEGAYARTGLISEVEVIDDYPSHVSAYTRRKHRWVRGDWQIMRWLFPAVPDYFGKLVANPISLLSRWKIVDNLRRSLTEFATFLLLVGGWFLSPGDALRWTLAALAIITLPSYLQYALSFSMAASTIGTVSFWKNAALDFVSMHAKLLLRLMLLCYQSLVTVDAIVRSLVRMAITHKRLLQWETSAQAELAADHKKDPLDSYLVWPPLISAVIAMFIVRVHPSSLGTALPFLVLWGLSKVICRWLNRPQHPGKNKLSLTDQAILRHASLRTWRFFCEFSHKDENWLIPDVVQDDEKLIVHRISPTNLGLLLNARPAAWDLGFLTVPEMVEATEKTIATARQMPKRDGHFYNWYDTRTLAPLSPLFISTVDNGNLVCCLWTLKQALVEARKASLFQPGVWQGIRDYLEMLEESLGKLGTEDKTGVAIRNLKEQVRSRINSMTGWTALISEVSTGVASLEKDLSGRHISDDAEWWLRQLSIRMRKIERMVRNFAPWLLPQFGKHGHLAEILDSMSIEDLTLETATAVYATLEEELCKMTSQGKSGPVVESVTESLLLLLAESEGHCHELAKRIALLEVETSILANALNFSCLYNPEKKLLSIGYDAEQNLIHDCHYNLLASEARAAVFVAVAKGEIPQQTWFNLDRSYTAFNGRRALISWTGTMFEYLLPSLWMKSYPNTLLEHSARTAVCVQRKFAGRRSIPWGISESSCNKKNTDGQYRYHAFGVQQLAFDRLNANDLVVSPYSTFLSLSVDGKAATKNLHKMKAMGLVGVYGFYEACDFTKSNIGPERPYEIVRCWMAHHQGMSLLSAANALCDAAMQRRFHAEPVVAATERLLHEKFPRILSAVRIDKGESDRQKPMYQSRMDLLQTAGMWFPAGHSALPRNQ